MKKRDRNNRVLSNLGLAKLEAHRYSQKTPESFEDLCQVAYLGLIKAAERFNPDLPYAFSSYACPMIRGEIRHYLRDKCSVVRIPKGLHKTAETVLSFDAGDGLSDNLSVADISPEPYDDLTYETLQVLNRLKPRLRDTLNALYFDGLTLDECADRFSVSHMTISRDKKKAIEWMQARLERAS